MLPQSLCLLHKVVPIAYMNNSVTLAMVNPSNLVAFDDVRRYIKGVIIEPQVCTDEDFRKFMDSVYPDLMGVKEEKKEGEEERGRRERRREERKRPARTHSRVSRTCRTEILSGLEVQQEEEEKVSSATELITSSEDAPVVRLANNILALAIKKGASDIHIEPQEKGVVLRFRIDGVLYVETILSKKIQMPLASRLKILSRLDISERRMPQDGRISIKIEDRAIDFRVSTVPAKFGEKIVMRILDKSGSLLPLDKIIVHGPTVDRLRWMINQPYGIIYVTGPTGSGKTTTLYSSLAKSIRRKSTFRRRKTRLNTIWPASARSRLTRISASTSRASFAHFCDRTRTLSSSAKLATRKQRRFRWKLRLPATSYSRHCTPTMRPVPSPALRKWVSSHS